MLAMTGTGGKLGQLVAEALLRRTPGSNLRFGTRAPGKLEGLARRGAEIVRADFDDPASLAVLFSGAEAVLVISGDAPNDPRIRQHEAAFSAAKSAGAERILYTSFVNATAESRFSIARSHAASETMLRALGVPYTILRNNLYAENIMIEAARATGELAQPGAHGKVAFITQADVAEATAGALTGQGHDNKIYEITGPEALDQFEIAALLSAAWSRPVRAVETAPESYADALAGKGLPPFVVELVVSLRAAVAAGEFAQVSEDARRLAGRAIEPASHFLKRA